ncbi:MAG: AIR synthase related protein [Bacillus sp. (in: firmicutes)]
MAQIRDLTIIELPSGGHLVTAVDISAAIGEKTHDALCVPPELTGRLTARVALLEVMASGAQIVAVSDVVGAEMEPTGKRVIAGIQEELQQAGLAEIELNGSTEENMATTQTSVGVMVVGTATPADLKVNRIQGGAVLFGYGEPRMGQELLQKPDLEVTYDLVRHLAASSDVLEIVPVGSKGIRYEAAHLAELNSHSFRERAACNPDWLHKSAGPATALVVAIRREAADAFVERYPEAYLLGELVKHC